MVIIGNRFSKSTLLITALLHPCSSLVVTPEYKAFLRGHPCHHLQATLLSTWRHLADTQRSAACWYKQERLSIRCRASLCICFFFIFVFLQDKPDWYWLFVNLCICLRHTIVTARWLRQVFEGHQSTMQQAKVHLCILFVSFCICLRDAQIRYAAVKAFQLLSTKYG